MCKRRCPSDIPYYTDTKECYKRCPTGYYKMVGNFSCGLVTKWQFSPKKVSFISSAYNYVHDYVRSFSCMDLYIQDSLNIAGFLYASAEVVSLKLRATTA